MRTRPAPETNLTKCRERVSQLETVFNVTSLLNTELDLEQLLNKIMRAARKVMAAEVAALALIDEEHGDLVFQIAFGEQGNLLETLGGLQRMKLGTGIHGNVAHSGIALMLKDCRDHPTYNPEY
ncbi:MAG: hypothetical protein IIA62_07980, partial [Nitrospinae bacterium]|nr:hypothetical protein [Nitrospinota bacterium]